MDLQMKWPGIQIVVDLLSTPWFGTKQAYKRNLMRRVVHLRGPDFDHGRFSPASKGCFEDVFPLEDVFFSFEVQVTLDLVHGYYELREGLESTGGPPEFDFLNWHQESHVPRSQMEVKKDWKAQAASPASRHVVNTWWEKWSVGRSLSIQIHGSIHYTQVVSSCFIHTLPCHTVSICHATRFTQSVFPIQDLFPKSLVQSPKLQHHRAGHVQSA